MFDDLLGLLDGGDLHLVEILVRLCDWEGNPLSFPIDSNLTSARRTNWGDDRLGGLYADLTDVVRERELTEVDPGGEDRDSVVVELLSLHISFGSEEALHAEGKKKRT